MVVFGALMLWGMFTKAGEPGWASMVPLYNLFVLLKIVGRPAWWFVLCFIPLVNIIISILVSIDAAKSYGKEAGFGIGIWILPFIFLPILSWGSAQYTGPAAKIA